MSKWLFKAWLKGSHVVPPVQTDAFGKAVFKLKHWNNSWKLFYAVKVHDVESLRKIDLHLGRKGHNGPVIATLFGPTTPGISVQKGIVRGVLDSSDFQGPLADHSLRKLIKLFLLGKVYVNVHTTQHPNGEIRGQVKKVHKHKHKHRNCARCGD